MTKRRDVRRGENAAILLSTRPAERPACCTSDQEKGKESSLTNGFFGKTTQRDPDGVSRFSSARKKTVSEPSRGTSAMSHTSAPGGHSLTQSTSGPKTSRRAPRNSGESPRA